MPTREDDLGGGVPRRRSVRRFGHLRGEAGQPQDRRPVGVQASFVQSRIGHPQIRDPHAELLNRIADTTEDAARVLDPVVPRPHLEPIDDQLRAITSAQGERKPSGENREEREGRALDDVVVAAMAEEMNENAEPEPHGWPDATVATRRVVRTVRGDRDHTVGTTADGRTIAVHISGDVRDGTGSGETASQGVVVALEAADVLWV